MLIKIFPYSEGSGDAAGEYPELLEGREDSPPETFGDMKMTVALINGIARKHTHTSGVISFAKEDKPSREQLFAVMRDFEAHFFAGLDHDQYNITWVRHSHLGREELHFLTPRLELTTGKALNIAPPSESHAYKDAFVKAWNYENGWADPSDPERARELSQAPIKEGQKHGYRLRETREEIHAYVTDMIVAGKIVDRQTLITTLEEAGLPANRQGKDYISVTADDGNAVRLKGRIYARDWTYDKELDRAHPAEDRPRPFRNPEDDRIRAEAARAKCIEYRQKRAEYNRARYQRSALKLAENKFVDLDDSVGVRLGRNDLYYLSVQPELIPRPTNRRKTKRVDEHDTDGQPARRRVHSSEHGGVELLAFAARHAATDVRARTAALHTDRKLTNGDEFHRSRNAALAYVEASARHAFNIRTEADFDAGSNQLAAKANHSAAEKLGSIVGACVRAVDHVISAVRSFFFKVKIPGSALPASDPGPDL